MVTVAVVPSIRMITDVITVIGAPCCTYTDNILTEGLPLMLSRQLVRLGLKLF